MSLCPVCVARVTLPESVLGRERDEFPSIWCTSVNGCSSVWLQGLLSLEHEPLPIILHAKVGVDPFRRGWGSSEMGSGIAHHVLCPYEHQQNGLAERKHHHTFEVGLSLLAQAYMQLEFWDGSFLAIIYLISRKPSKVINYETLLELLFHKTLDYEPLCVFGRVCWPNICSYNTHKLLFCSIFWGLGIRHVLQRLQVPILD